MAIIVLTLACVVFGTLYLLATPVGIILGTICFIIVEIFLMVGRLGHLASERMHRAVK